MRQQVTVNNFADENGNPTGGTAFGTGISISWQNGPLGCDANRQEPNGAFVEDVIYICAERIKFYQQSKFACSENALALEHLETALDCLDKRTKGREARNVEGTHEV